jgi:cobalt-precorrin-5B (C1)-methyltransferase
MVKLAQGALDLHSARSQVDFAALADMAADIGLPRDRVASANAVLEVASFANSSQRQALANSVAAAAHATALKHLKGAGVNLEIIIVSRDGEPLGRAGSEMPRAGRPA